MYNTTTRSYTMEDASGTYNWFVEGLARADYQNMTDAALLEWIDTHIEITKSSDLNELEESIQEMEFPRMGYTTAQTFENAEEYIAFKTEEIESDLKNERESLLSFVKAWIAR